VAFIPWVTGLVEDTWLAYWVRSIHESSDGHLSPQAILLVAFLVCEQMGSPNNPTDLSPPRIPDAWRRAYLNRPIERLPKDVMVLFDRHEKLAREKDLVHAELIQAQRSLDKADIKIWILTVAFSAEGCIIGWLVKEFLRRLH
jgi:hypothetical protein